MGLMPFLLNIQNLSDEILKKVALSQKEVVIIPIVLSKQLMLFCIWKTYNVIHGKIPMEIF